MSAPPSPRSLHEGAPNGISRIGRLLLLYWPPILAAVLLIAGWELAVWWFQLPNFVLPTPREIILVSLQDPQTLLQDTATTVGEAVSGYIAGSLFGLLLAILFVTWPSVERCLLPFYVTINSVPMIAYGPLAIIWFGIGPASKVALIFLAVSYTVLINAVAGLRSCDPVAIDLLRSFGASNRTILVKLRMPASLPWIFSGLRVAVVHAMILAVVLEMLGANSGLGWSIYKATQMMSFVEAWVAVGAAVVVSLIIYTIVTRIGKRVAWW